MYKILKVSTSGYYNWLKAKASNLWLYNQKLSKLITSIFKDSHESYGAPRIKKA
jgi:putative transposase